MIRLRVREVAESKGMNMQDLANRSQTAYSTIVDWWYDRARRIDKATLNRLCAALEVEPGELIVRDSAGGENAEKHEAPGLTFTVAAPVSAMAPG